MAPRYFLEQPPHDEAAVLAGSGAHHLAHVMRAKQGSEVTLFDGSGWEYAATIMAIRRSEIELRVVSRQVVDREAKRLVTLAVALPKGDRQKWLVEKAVELGVARLAPLETTRGVAQPEGNALERLRRAVIEASKQCGRNRLMEIAAATGWNELSRAEPDSHLCRCVAHPASLTQGESHTAQAAISADDERACVLAIGPEGGFTEAEMELARSSGWQAVDLGPRILRVETAAIALAALAIGLK